MATANVSEDEKSNYSKKVADLFCSLDIPSAIYGQLTFLAVLNAFLSITAFLGNFLFLVALRKESSLHPPSKLLLRSLAVTDLCVGLISEPLLVIFLVTAVNENWNNCRYVGVALFVTGSIFAQASLLTLTAVSVDRLLALLLGLRYRQVVSLKRTCLVIITFWAVPAVFSMMRLFWGSPITSRFRVIVVSMCIVTTTFTYTKIFLTLRRHRSQVQDHVQQSNQANQLNIARYKKAVSTALWLQFTLVICYLPQVILATLFINTKPSSSSILAVSYAITLAFLNSSLNPILYCLKIDEVRQAVKDAIRQVVCCWALVELYNP